MTAVVDDWWVIWSMRRSRAASRRVTVRFSLRHRLVRIQFADGMEAATMSQLLDNEIARQFDKLPPNSLESERALLASMMLDKDMIGQVVQIVDREAFFQADHQIIYDLLVKLYEQNRPIDAVLLREELVKRQLLDEIGGNAYLMQILGSVPSSAHGAHYAS